MGPTTRGSKLMVRIVCMERRGDSAVGDDDDDDEDEEDAEEVEEGDGVDDEDDEDVGGVGEGVVGPFFEDFDMAVSRGSWTRKSRCGCFVGITARLVESGLKQASRKVRLRS